MPPRWTHLSKLAHLSFQNWAYVDRYPDARRLRRGCGCRGHDVECEVGPSERLMEVLCSERMITGFNVPLI